MRIARVDESVVNPNTERFTVFLDEISTLNIRNIEFFRTMLGIESDAPGFGQVKIEPHLGTIRKISGEIPHPKGKVSVQYINKNNKWVIDINLPFKTIGSFIWKGKSYPLKEGKNSLQI